MRKVLIDNWNSDWESEGLLSLRECPICKFICSDSDLVVSVYKVYPAQCPCCGAKFIISQNITLYQLVEDEKS